jgi:hypothetical protein
VHGDGTPTSELWIMSDVIDLLKEVHGTRPASEIGPLALKAVRQVMIDRGNSAGTRSTTTSVESNASFGGRPRMSSSRRAFITACRQ